MSKAEGEPQAGLFRRALAGLGQFLADLLGEGVLAVSSCLLLAGVVAAGAWGWQRHPTATVVAGSVFVGVLGFGAWDLRRAAGRRRSRLATIASILGFVFMI